MIRWIARASGMLVVLAPTVAVFALVPAGRQFRDSRRWRVGIVMALFLLAFPVFVHSGAWMALQATWTFLAATLLFHGGYGAFVRAWPKVGEGVPQGMLVGIVVLVVAGAVEVLAGDTRAAVMFGHPNFYGMTLVALCAIGAEISRSRNLRYALLSLGLVAAMLSGSRVAVLTLGLYVTTQLALRPHRRKTIVLMAVVAAIGLALLAHPRFRTNPLSLHSSDVASVNLARGSEDLGYWSSAGVEVEKTPLEGPSGMTAFRLVKTLPEAWRRPQVPVTLRRGEPYVASAYFLTAAVASGMRPGLLGWGRDSGLGDAFQVSATLHLGEVQAHALGPGRILDYGQSQVGDWTRLWVSFEFSGEAAALPWSLGPTPHQELGAPDEATLVSSIQLERGLTPSRYVPAPKSSATPDGEGALTARLEMARVAAMGILEAPILGHGIDMYSEYFQRLAANEAAVASPPTHAHNLVLHIVFERGLIGGLGFLFLAGLAFLCAWRSRPTAGALVLVLLAANTFDITLLNGAILYPLSAGLGWIVGAGEATK